jgi:hypothetical protein
MIFGVPFAALLSGAFWLQKLSGVGVKAIAAAAAVVVATILIVGGVAWLRHDARSDERAQCNAEAANARIRAHAALQARQRRSEQIAAARAEVLARELDVAARRLSELEGALAARPRTLCYPKQIIDRLNR